MLSEQNRTKLDGIVSQMTANGETEETIRFVVEDFKSKYTEQQAPEAPKMGGFLDALVSPTETSKAEPIDFEGMYEGAKKIVKATPAIAGNLKDTFTTKEGISNLWKVAKGAGLPSLSNVVDNSNQIFWGGAQKMFSNIGLDTFAEFAGNDMERSKAGAKKSSEEIKKFFYGNGEDVIGYSDPTDTRSFLDKISSPDGEKEMAKVLGAQLPTFGALLGITVLAKGTNIPAIPATLSASFAMNTGDAYQQGKDYVESTGQELTPEMDAKLQKASILVGASTAPLDAYGMDRILSPSKFVNIKNIFISKAINGILDTGVDAVAEGGTEAVQEIIQNAWARTYNENQNLFEGAGEAFFGGAVFGGGSSGLLNSSGLLRQGVLERLKNGDSPEKIKADIKADVKDTPQGAGLSDDKIDEAINDASEVFNGVVDDIASKLDSGKSVNEVALEISQGAPTSIDTVVTFVQNVADGKVAQPEAKALEELQAIDEKVLKKSAKDMQSDFEQVQSTIDAKVKELRESVSDLKERVDKATNRTAEKKQLKAQLENAREELRKAESSFFDKVQQNAQAFRDFIAEYVTGKGATQERAVEIADTISNYITEDANINDTTTIEELVNKELGTTPDTQVETPPVVVKKTVKKAVKKEVKKATKAKEEIKTPIEDQAEKARELATKQQEERNKKEAKKTSKESKKKESESKKGKESKKDEAKVAVKNAQDLIFKDSGVYENDKRIATLETEEGKAGNLTIFNIETTAGGNRKGYGTRILSKIFESYNSVDGTATKSSLGFWEKVGATILGTPDSNGDVEFILTKEQFNNYLDETKSEGDNGSNEADTNTNADDNTGGVSTPVQDSPDQQGGAGEPASVAGQGAGATKRPTRNGSTSRKRPSTRLTNEQVEEAVSKITSIDDKGIVTLTGEITPEILDIANQYKTGGVTKEGRGILDEYYTNQSVVDMVKSIIEFPAVPIKVLEPSAGTGNFLHALPEFGENQVGAFEINPISARIAKIFHNNAQIVNAPFEKLFIDERGKARTFATNFDLVIGNPPYGEHRGEYLGLGEEPTLKKYEDYFVKRGLDTLKEGGLLAMVLPSSFLDRQGSMKNVEIEVAYRLPEGAFEGTKVGTDIVVLRKKTGAQSEQGSAYFKNQPENVLGEEKTRKNRFGKMESYIDGDMDTAINLFYTKRNESEAVKLLKDNNIPDTQENKEDAESAIEEAGAKATEIMKGEKKGKETIEKKITRKVSKGEKTASLSEQFSEYTPEELEAWKNVEQDGSFKEEAVAKYKDQLNYIGGKYYNDFYYKQGDIYEKMTQLKSDLAGGKITKKQFDIQEKKLKEVLPERERLSDAKISPNLEFVKNLKVEGDETLQDMFLQFIRTLPYEVFGGSNKYEVEEYTRNRPVTGNDKVRNENVRIRRKLASDNLFAKFLDEGLDDAQKEFVQETYNRTFNFYAQPDYTKVPMFSEVNTTFKGKPFSIRSVQKGGIGRLVANGVGLLAHDVGFGKTISGVLAVSETLHRGWAKKPIIVVPNENVYQQWVNTIEELVPNAKLNLLGNLGVSYKGDLSSLTIPEGSITLVTYEGLKRLSFKDRTYEDLSAKFQYISDDLKAHKSERQKQKDMESIKEIAGRGKKGTRADLFFEDLGFDHLTFDEVHNANHIVSKVKLEKGQASEYNRFALRSSDLGMKTWLASQYIQAKMNGRNVNLLSATPFTNHPLEYYSVFSLIADKMLQKMGFSNVNEFFGTFMEAENDYEFKADGSYQRKTDIRSFKNYRQFKKLREAFMDFKDGEQSGIVRPNRVQQTYEIPQSQYGLEMEAKAQEIFKENENEDGKGAKVLRAITELRKIAFSPFASKFSIDIGKDYKKFAEESPKIKVLMDLIKQNKKDKPEAGQIIYVDQVGVEFLPLMRDYLINEVGYKEKEVEIISGATAKPKRVDIQDRYNKGEVKVVLGSEAIKEGLNLQENTTDLYILSLPWNFTQLRQVIGRGWRQGNRWQNIRINNLFIQDSIDVFLSQKLENKQKRFEASVKSDANVIDVGDISFDEMKFDLIKDPKARAKLELEAEKERLAMQISQEKAEVSFATRKLETIAEAKKAIESYQDDIKSENERIQKKKETGEEYSTYWVEEYTKRLEKAKETLKEETEKVVAKGVNVDILLKKKEEGDKKVKELQEKYDNLEKSFEDRVKKLTAEMPPRKEFDKTVSDAFVAERENQNKSFYQLREDTKEENIVPVQEVKEIKNASKTKVLKTVKKTVAKRTTGDPVLDVIINKELSVEQKIDTLLSKKQENKEFKDIGKRVIGSKKETAIIKTIQQYGSPELINAIFDLYGVDAISALYKKDDILADTELPSIEKDKENGVPSYIAVAKQKILSAINHSPNFREKKTRYSSDRPFYYHTKSTPYSWSSDLQPEILKMYPKLMREYVTQLTNAKTFDDLRGLRVMYVKPDGTFISNNGGDIPQVDGRDIDNIEIKSNLFGNISKIVEDAHSSERRVSDMQEIIDVANNGTEQTSWSDRWKSLDHSYGDVYRVGYYDTKAEAEASIKENKKKAVEYANGVINVYSNTYEMAEKKKATKVETDLKHGNFKPLERIETTRTVEDSKVSPETLTNDFGVKSVQFGNYMDDATAREHIRHTIASLQDMEELLNLDIKAIISNKGLSLAFGARGGGGANAHYEPSNNIINLTKGKGDGSFFHEFVHFMDMKLGGRYRGKWSSGKRRWYIGDYLDQSATELIQALLGEKIIREVTIKPEESPYISETSPVMEWYKKDMPFDEAVKKAELGMSGYSTMYLAKDIANIYRKEVKINGKVYNDTHAFVKGSKEYGGAYWSQPEEMLARAGQAYIEDKMIEAGIKNNYLTRTTISEVEGDGLSQVYPQGEDRKVFNKYFDHLFEQLRKQYPRGEAKFKIEKGNFKNVPYTKNDAIRYLDDMKKRLNIDFDTHFVDTIIADYSIDPMRRLRVASQFAVGVMQDNTIALVNDLMAYTAEHESVHLTLSNLDRIEAFKREGITREKLMRAMADKKGIVWSEKTDLEIEEQIAYDYEAYINGKSKPEGILGRFFTILKNLAKKFADAIIKTNGDIIKDYYDILSEGRSIESELVRLENQGIVESYIEDGILDVYKMEQGQARFKISEEKDAHLQKLKKIFNETSDKVTSLEENMKQWKTDLDNTLDENAKSAELVSEIDEATKELARFTKRTDPVGELTQRGAEVVDEYQFENKEEAQKAIYEYLKRKQELIETRNQLRIIRRKLQNAKAEGKGAKATLRDVERRLRLRRRLLEQKDFYVGMGIARGAKLQMKMIKARGVVLRDTQDTIGISDERAKKIIAGRRIHLMTEKEFNDFMQEFANKAMELRATLDARDEVRSIIQSEQLNKVDNLISALGLPSIDKMTQEQASEFASILYQYQFGDTFLTKRELDTTIRTEYGNIRTERELLDKISEITGISTPELRAIDAKGSDIYKNWLQLANKNLFYKWLVGRRMLAKVKEIGQVQKFRVRLDELVKNARKSRKATSLSESIWDTIAPTDDEVFKALDTGDFTQLTPEEKLLADFLVTMFRTKYENLAKNFTDFKGRQNYVTHMQRTFFETLKNTGSLTEAWQSFVRDSKEHENALEILAGQTGEILAFDKFLPYMLKRSGTLVPSKNVSRIALTYFTATTRKELLDEFIPEAMLTLHGYKMITGQTEKGLDLKPALEEFTKKYLNDAKGRKIEYITRQGSGWDNFWAGFTAWISAKYIGGNPVLAFFNLFGDMLALSAGTSNIEKINSLVRIFQKNNASEAIQGIIGHNPLSDLANTQEGVIQKVMPFWFSLMSATSYLANQLTVRGLLTQEEFRTGIVSDERILEIAQQINKFKLTDSYGRSLVGNTTAGKASLQFKTWAVPFLLTTAEHLMSLVRAWRSKSFTPENKQQAIELTRIVVVGAIMYATVQALKSAYQDDDDKDSYLWRQIENNLNTIYGILAMPFTKESLQPVVMSAIGQLQDLLQQVWTMERYQRPTATNYTGDLKFVKTLKDVVIPAGATRIFKINADTGTPKERLLDKAIETGEFDAEEIAQKTSMDWATKKPEARQKVIGEITQQYNARKKYPDSEVVAIILGENKNEDRVRKLVQYAQKVGLDEAYSEVKGIMKDRELYANQEKKTGAFISAQLFRDFQVEIKKLKKQQQ